MFTDNPMAGHILKVLIMGLVLLGALAPEATSVFFFSDPMMGILALVNLVALTMLFPIGMRLLRDYREQLAQGVEHPALHVERYADLDIDREAWADAAK